MENGELINLTIDYSRTLEQTIADGNYSWRNSNIKNENFPIPQKMIGKKVDVVAKIFYFNRKIHFKTAIYEMKTAGYRPANLMELLTLKILLLKLQQLPIVALGSVWSFRRHCQLCPNIGCSGQDLFLSFYEIEFDPYWHFLGIKNN